MSSSTYKLFDTVFGLGEVSINKLIENGAKTIDDLKYKPKYYNTLKEPTKDYLLYYDDLQERIPRDEVMRHKEKIESLIGEFYRFDIVGSFRRGEEYCGDIDVLFTTKLNYNPSLEYVSGIVTVLSNHGYLIKTLKKGHKVMNGIAKLTPYSIARRVDLFFSPPELYAFALLTKTGDVAFNKSLRSCIKEKNPDYTLSELGIRINGHNVKEFHSVDSILNFIGIGRREPHEMVGNIPAGSCIESRSSPVTSIGIRTYSFSRGSPSLISRPSSLRSRSVKKRKRDDASTISPLTQSTSYDSDATYE
jgi:DNA polymerase/3'-5' exonuclease PolX